MTESRLGPTPAAPQDVDPDALIDALRARGAERFDPVGFRFVEALARRAAVHRGKAGCALDRRLARALTEYGERFDRAEREAGEALAHGAARFPEAADGLRQHCDASDFGGLHRLLARLEAGGGSGPLAELLAHIRGQAAGDAAGAPADAARATAEPQGELKALTYFRTTWSKLSVDRQLSHAFAQAPENAGPLNSHFLVLQSLKLMRDLSPEYVEQFVSYVDALLWLDETGSGDRPAQKNAARGERDKKRKPRRGNAS